MRVLVKRHVPVGHTDGISFASIDEVPSMPADVMIPRAAVAFVLTDGRDLLVQRKETFMHSAEILLEKLHKCIGKYSKTYLMMEIYPMTSPNRIHNSHLLTTMSQWMMLRDLAIPLIPYDSSNFMETLSYLILRYAPDNQLKAELLIQEKLQQTLDISHPLTALPLLKTLSPRESGLEDHECFALHDDMASLCDTAEASIQQLRQCALDKQTVMELHAFLHDDLSRSS